MAPFARLYHFAGAIDRIEAICERLSPAFRPDGSSHGRPASVR
jgi:hypothetical protein